MENSTVHRFIRTFAASGLALVIASSSLTAAQASSSSSSLSRESRQTISVYSSSLSLANAKRAAQGYLNVMGFSRKGLIDQLVFEGYSRSIATKAVDSLNVNWNAQAVKVAKNYIKLMPFSRTALIDQLVFDGFTRSQATAGVKGVGY